jgi:hypothetical protein
MSLEGWASSVSSGRGHRDFISRQLICSSRHLFFYHPKQAIGGVLRLEEAGYYVYSTQQVRWSGASKAWYPFYYAFVYVDGYQPGEAISCYYSYNYCGADVLLAILCFHPFMFLASWLQLSLHPINRCVVCLLCLRSRCCGCGDQREVKRLMIATGSMD